MRLVLALALLGGCAPYDYDVPLDPHSPWPKFRHDARQTGRAPVDPVDRGARPWIVRTAKGLFSSPVIGGDGTVYIGSADRHFYALDGADGAVLWSFETGEIIDSSALLDDSGAVYFGSGDGHLYALERADGALRWAFEADDPSVNDAFIRWFEGNVAIGPDGTLVVPNDNFFVYGIDRDAGEAAWRFRVHDQTWSLPAIDADANRAFVGNNNLLPTLGGNTFALDLGDGAAVWEASESLGSVAASPLLTDDGLVVVGGFDGFVRAYDERSGAQRWSVGLRDHVYASPAQLSDGTIVQPGADGTVYGLDPADGAVRWAFDVGEPVRSSPAVDAEDHVYFGAGDGRLYVLDADGALRWSMQLVADDRNDLNSSPALGRDGVVIASESGEIAFVPYDWCLGEGAADAACATGGEDLPGDGVHLLFTSRYGSLLGDAPAAIAPNQALAWSLVVREGGDSLLARLDSSSVEVEVDPPAPVDVTVSGDRTFLTVVPREGFEGDAVTLTLRGRTLVDLDRDGLAFAGGVPGPAFEEVVSLAIDRSGPASLPLQPPVETALVGSGWEMLRVAAPLPTILPSYNQIGFDSLHFLIGLVEHDGSDGIGWVIGALPGPDGVAVPDPATQVRFPVRVRHADGAVTLESDGGMQLEAMNLAIAFDHFRLSARLDANGSAPDGAELVVSTICGDIPFYGLFLRGLGFCNPDTDVLHAFGAALLEPRPVESHASGPATARVDEGAVVVVLERPPFDPAEHVLSLLVVDPATGDPLPLAYGTGTQVLPSGEGVTVRLAAPDLPDRADVWLIVDQWPAARFTLP